MCNSSDLCNKKEKKAIFSTNIIHNTKKVLTSKIDLHFRRTGPFNFFSFV